MSVDWDSTDVVFVPLLRCPACGADRPLLVRSEKQGCGDQIRKHICRRCSSPFRLVIERNGELEWLPAENRQTENLEA